MRSPIYEVGCFCDDNYYCTVTTFQVMKSMQMIMGTGVMFNVVHAYDFQVCLLETSRLHNLAYGHEAAQPRTQGEDPNK